MGNDILEFLATREVIIVLVILGIIIAVYVVLWFIEYMKRHEEKKKLQNNTMELNKLVREVHNELKKEEKKVESVKEVKEEKTVKIEAEPIKVEPTVVEEPKIEEEPIEEVVIGSDAVSSVEVKPTIIDVKEDNVVSNDSLKLNDKFEEKVEIVEPSVITPVDAPKNEEEVIKYKDEVYTKTEAQQELERITEELRKIENEEKEENIELTKYETEQEENAIISLDELIAKGKTITEQNEATQYQDDGNEPISISELEERYRNNKEDIEVLEVEEKEEKKNKLSIDDFLNAKLGNNNKTTTTVAYSSNNSTYHPSPIISPIYGIEEPVKKNTTLELENTANLQKFDDEIRKTNEFLNKLRELQEKLD